MASNLVLKKRDLVKGVDTNIWFNYVHSSDYKPILDVLRFGPLSIDEIHKKINLEKSRSTLYRYLQDLIDLGLVVEAGRTKEKIVKREKTGSFIPYKILYDRTAELFLISRPEAKAWALEKSDYLAFALGTMIKKHFNDFSPRVKELCIFLHEFETTLERAIQDLFAKIIEDSKTKTQAIEILKILRFYNPKDSVTFIHIFSRLFWFLNQDDINILYHNLNQIFTNEVKGDFYGERRINGVSNSEDAEKGFIDSIDYTPTLYQPIKEKIWGKIMNYNHRAVLYLLRRPMTLQEIAENHHDAVLQKIKEDKVWGQIKIDKPPQKKKKNTIYKYVQYMKKAGLIIEAGRRIKEGKALTKILYARKALYVSQEKTVQNYNSDKWNRIINIIGVILSYHLQKKNFDREKLSPLLIEFDKMNDIINDPSFTKNLEYPPSEILYGIDILYLQVLLDTLTFFEWYLTIDIGTFKSKLESCFSD
jgi:hypothetical protein